MLSRRHYVHSNEPVGKRQRRDVIFIIILSLGSSGNIIKHSILNILSKYDEALFTCTDTELILNSAP